LRTQRLAGIRVALTGPRKAEEMGRMVEKQGGIPLIRPAQGTVFLDDGEVERELARLVEESVDWFIFTTGVGVETLLGSARNLGLEQRFHERLQQARIAARGYKAVLAVRKLGLNPVARDDDGTTAGLIRELAAFDLSGCRVALQLHGDPAPRLVGFLRERGAICREILPYRHIPPEEASLRQLTAEIISGGVDAVAFTSGPQVHFLLAYARDTGQLPELMQAFRTHAVAAAVGKFTAECLREEGVGRVVVPKEERMAKLVQALADYFDRREGLTNEGAI